jgi:hypothetical protein
MLLYSDFSGPWTLQISQDYPHTPRVTIEHTSVQNGILTTKIAMDFWWTDRWWVRINGGRRLPYYCWEDALQAILQACSLLGSQEEQEWLAAHFPEAEIVELAPAELF